MTDDLVKFLRTSTSAALNKAAADRIEALEREKREAALDALAAHGQAHDAYEAQLKAEARLAKLVEALRSIADAFGCECGNSARAVLAEIGGEA